MSKGISPSTEAKHQEILNAFESGKSVSEIREKFGYTDNHSVIYVLRKFGAYSLKDRKRSKKKMDVPKVLALQKAEWTMEMIMEEFDYDYTADEITQAVIEWLKD